MDAEKTCNYCYFRHFCLAGVIQHKIWSQHLNYTIEILNIKHFETLVRSVSAFKAFCKGTKYGYTVCTNIVKNVLQYR